MAWTDSLRSPKMPVTVPVKFMVNAVSAVVCADACGKQASAKIPARYPAAAAPALFRKLIESFPRLRRSGTTRCSFSFSASRSTARTTGMRLAGVGWKIAAGPETAYAISRSVMPLRKASWRCSRTPRRPAGPSNSVPSASVAETSMGWFCALARQRPSGSKFSSA